VLAYPEGADAGQAPDRAGLLARHPEFAVGLAEFFAGLDCVGLAPDSWRLPLDNGKRRGDNAT
jgi:hypothetical protein